MHINISLFLCILILDCHLLHICINLLHIYTSVAEVLWLTAHIKKLRSFTAHLHIYRFLDFNGSKYNLTFDLLAGWLWPTVKHSPAELCGGRQREAGVVELVAVVADADLELDGVIDVLEVCGRIKCHEERELPLPEKLLLDGKKNGWMIFIFLCYSVFYNLPPSFPLTSTTSKSSAGMSSVFGSGLSASFVVSSSKTRPRYATPSPWEAEGRGKEARLWYYHIF